MTAAPPLRRHAARSPLSGLTVLEGGGDAGAVAGRMLADLGAGVVKLATPPNAPASPALTRYRAVFDDGKTRLAPDAATAVVQTADIQIRSEAWPRAVDAVREDAIVLTLSPWGAEGPWAGRASSDLVAIAACGYLGMTGDPGAAPVKPAAALASERLAALHGMAAILLALRRRRLTGRGSRIDLSIRDAGLWMLVNTYQFWDTARINPVRRGAAYSIGDMGLALPLLFDCADGAVVWLPLAGRDARGSIALVARMAAAGAAPDWLSEMDWSRFELESQSQIDRFLAPFRAYFRSRSRAALYADAVADGTLLAPVQPFADVLDDPQLAARGAWTAEGPGGFLRPRAPVRIEGVSWAAR